VRDTCGAQKGELLAGHESAKFEKYLRDPEAQNTCKAQSANYSRGPKGWALSAKYARPQKAEVLAEPQVQHTGGAPSAKYLRGPSPTSIWTFPVCMCPPWHEPLILGVSLAQASGSPPGPWKSSLEFDFLFVISSFVLVESGRAHGNHHLNLIVCLLISLFLLVESGRAHENQNLNLCFVG